MERKTSFIQVRLAWLFCRFLTIVLLGVLFCIVVSNRHRNRILITYDANISKLCSLQGSDCCAPGLHFGFVLDVAKVAAAR
jgi:hypothetical protein